MIVTYRFLLPTDSDELEQVRRAPDMDSAIYEFTSWLRNQRKYPAEGTPDVALAECNRIYDEWWRILGDHDIDPFT